MNCGLHKPWSCNATKLVFQRHELGFSFFSQQIHFPQKPIKYSLWTEHNIRNSQDRSLDDGCSGGGETAFDVTTIDGSRLNQTETDIEACLRGLREWTVFIFEEE
jgi:hypothetical protein